MTWRLIHHCLNQTVPLIARLLHLELVLKAKDGLPVLVLPLLLGKKSPRRHLFRHGLRFANGLHVALLQGAGGCPVLQICAKVVLFVQDWKAVQGGLISGGPPGHVLTQVVGAGQGE